MTSYRPQRSWGNVIFSQESVILSTGVCLVGGGYLVETPPGTATAAGGTHLTGMHSSIGKFT